MSQIVPPGSDNIMQCTPQSKDTQDNIASFAPLTGSSSSRSSSSNSDCFENKINSMRPIVNYSYPNSNGSSTPVSTRSSSSYESNASSSSSSVSMSMSMPKRSFMKSNLKTSQSVGTNLNMRSSPPTVRFADPEPLPKSHTWPAPKPKTTRQPEPRLNRIPNPMLQYQHHHARSLPSLVPSSGLRYTVGPQAYATPPPPRVSRPPERSTKTTQNQTSASVSARAPPKIQGPGWSNNPLPSPFSPPTITPGSRVPSHQSTISNASTQSAPAVLSTPTPTTTSPPGQYNALQNYQPCLYPSCTAHYTPAHAGFTYYLPQGPYSLARLHGYCPHHANCELKETNALCKREWESLRQNAGRKTLGLIAAEFDIFLERFREERTLEDAKLVRDLKRRVLGVAQPAGGQRKNSGKGKAVSTQDRDSDRGWDWRYTPRPCTTVSCSSAPYSPYANHFYAFYHTRRPSTFLPLQTLCPRCSRAEVETVEKSVTEKWASRGGWDQAEWKEWYSSLVSDREMERAFSATEQEKAVRERGAARWVATGEEMEEEQGVVVGKKVRRSIFKRLFGGKTS